MPLISEFLGIKIYMYWEDDMPPHFHVQYGGDKAIIVIRTGEMLAGHLPPSILREVKAWRDRHVAELDENWMLCQRAQSPKKITP